jgi:hypothetical protein
MVTLGSESRNLCSFIVVVSDCTKTQGSSFFNSITLSGVEPVTFRFVAVTQPVAYRFVTVDL